MAYLGQLENLYCLDDELSAIEGRRSDEPRRGESVFEDCKQMTRIFILLCT